MYSQKGNCTAPSLFPKQNYNVISPNLAISSSCISEPFTYSQDQSAYLKKNWSFILGIPKSDFRYSVFIVHTGLIEKQKNY
jgi:hypothetical protein